MGPFLLPSSTGRRLLAVGVLTAGILGSAGCDGTETSAADRHTCRHLQRMIDALGDGRDTDAVGAYDRMIADAADRGAATPISRLVAQMAAITDARIDESKLEMSEVPELAQQAMVASGDALAELVRACGAAGLRVTGLDRAGAGA